MLRTRSSGWPFLAALVVVAVAPSPAAGQTCFAYSDGVNAASPIRCVQKSDLTSSCAWPTDCTTAPATTPQTVREMHEAWHACFGPTGGSTPPIGRGQRWYAFHRQFEYDFNLWRMTTFPPTDPFGRGNPIEQLDWCPGMNLRVAHDGAGLAPGSHPAGCGEGPGRPANVPCLSCIAMPQCMFVAGAGPGDCPSAASASCSAGGVSFPHTALEQFRNVDDVAKLLDARFHGHMHAAIWVADLLGPTCNPFVLGGPDTGCIYNGDTLGSDCSPRDPMFWRLHKALDDVVRAWQDQKAADLVVVVDRSGSMAGSDPSGVSKLEAALRALEYLGDLLEDARSDGQTNRIGIVSYSSSASTALPLTAAGPGLVASAPFQNALNSIRTAGPGGCTGIGQGIGKALELLCPNASDCRLNPEPPPAGTNGRKAILLLTDGVENVPPCLQPAGASGATCGGQCFGPQIDYAKVEFTQFVGVGFGAASSLNGDMLTLLAERQGGIYVNNPGAPGDDLKYFFTMAFGQLSDEFLFADPRGTLAVGELATPPVEYQACGDEGKVTYTSGWDRQVRAGEMRLLVTDPGGDLVRAGQPGIESSRRELWEFRRAALKPGSRSGAWRGQLIRPHRQYYNGFAPDAFADPAAGETLIRRQIQRLCPDDCRRALLYEQGVLAPDSTYRRALKREAAGGVVGGVTAARDPRDFADKLRNGSWDLLVYARLGADAAEPYDEVLAKLLCAGQRAIVTDARGRAAGSVLECARLRHDGSRDWKVLEGDGRLLDGELLMVNPGYPAATFGLVSAGGGVQATANGGRSVAVMARGEQGAEQNWFVDVLGRGLGKLSPVAKRVGWKTGDPLEASVRILPSLRRAGGWDHVDARVEVEYPLRSVGTLLAERKLGRDDRPKDGDSRSAALQDLVIPTGKAVFRLYDDGTHGDIEPRNGQWTATLQGLGAVDGNYKLRYMLDLTANGCTTRREATQDIFVDLRVDPSAAPPRVVVGRPGGKTTLVVRPADTFGNLWGPGRAAGAGCAPRSLCRVEETADRGDGSFELTLSTAPGLSGVRVDAFGTAYHVPIACPDCPRLGKLTLPGRETKEHLKLEGEIALSGPTPPGQAGVVYLTSSKPLLVSVPETVTVPPGASRASFPVEVFHAHHGAEAVVISARLGDDELSWPLFVRPVDKGPGEPFRPRDDSYLKHLHPVHDDSGAKR